MKIRILFLLLASILFSCNEKVPADFVIRNGLIIDGLGSKPMEADLVIRDGKMEVIKREESVDANQTLDATGLIVAPGFIDVHNHTDRRIGAYENRLNEGFIRQGVTTIVGGPDGGWAPSTLRKLLASYDSIGIGTNVAFYIGHNGIRQEVMADDQQRPPTEEELNKMKALVKEGMELGAIGLSTGLMYEPGLYSTTEEIIELAKEVAPYNGIYDSHVRNPVHAFVKSHREVIEISTSANITGKLGHLKGVGLQNKGVINEVIKMVEKYREEGFNIVSDQYPYDGAQTEIIEQIIVIPDEIKEGEEIGELYMSNKEEEALNLMKQVLSDKNKRASIKEASENGINGGFSWLKATGYSSMRITASNDFPELVGKYLSEIAEERQMTGFDLVCDLIINSKDRVSITLGGIDENDLQTLLSQPWNIVASDGAYTKNSTSPGGHPRSTGTFPKVLGHYVRELNLLTLEEAIRKMTSLPAYVIGFENRGRIKNGLPADVVVFDPNTIIDKSTFEQPNIYSTGVKHVFVNGIPVLLNEEMTDKAPGRYLNRRTEGKEE